MSFPTQYQQGKVLEWKATIFHSSWADGGDAPNTLPNIVTALKGIGGKPTIPHSSWTGGGNVLPKVAQELYSVGEPPTPFSLISAGGWRRSTIFPTSYLHRTALERDRLPVVCLGCIMEMLNDFPNVVSAPDSFGERPTAHGSSRLEYGDAQRFSQRRICTRRFWREANCPWFLSARLWRRSTVFPTSYLHRTALERGQLPMVHLGWIMERLNDFPNIVSAPDGFRERPTAHGSSRLDYGDTQRFSQCRICTRRRWREADCPWFVSAGLWRRSTVFPMSYLHQTALERGRLPMVRLGWIMETLKTLPRVVLNGTQPFFSPLGRKAKEPASFLVWHW
ncbi:uncharacterized protein LOC122463986 [Chelonia mydas]|uniref:uncharacterized protein LOC122463986 n=1 Tax=Chelonia mydas TaxID=8469 RepID=UPI001CAA0254|nr:uncharacterized protein LOC122463986 [Chelonia mydas]